MDERGWLADQLRERGYAVAPGTVESGLLVRLRDGFVRFEDSDVPSAYRAPTGAFLPMDLTDHRTVEALLCPAIWRAVTDLGWSEPKLHSFYVSTKPPGAEALPWHCDVYYPWPGPVPSELFLLVYLHDTTPVNGCLRVVPGSHRNGNAVAAARHTDGPASAATRPDEVAVPVRAGDLIIADRRLLHATYPNHTGQWRTCLTIAVAPDFAALPASIQARIVANPCLPRPGWWADGSIDRRLHALLPRYDGDAEPVAIG